MQREAVVPVTQEEVDAALAVFNAGLVRENDERKARGYNTFYHPKDSMRAALEAFARHRAHHDLIGDDHAA